MTQGLEATNVIEIQTGFIIAGATLFVGMAMSLAVLITMMLVGRPALDTTLIQTTIKEVATYCEKKKATHNLSVNLIDSELATVCYKGSVFYPPKVPKSKIRGA